MIVAVANRRVIGKGNELAWHIKDDLRRFRVMTEYKTIIVGRTTFEQLRKAYESIGKALPDRNQVVLTKDRDYTIDLPKCYVCHSVEEALAKASEIEEEEVFVAGGATIFAQMLPLVDRLYLTKVDLDVDGDAFFPDYSEFSKVIGDEPHLEGEIKYRYLTLEKV
jgi:dihydrofolate reductase